MVQLTKENSIEAHPTIQELMDVLKRKQVAIERILLLKSF